MNTRQDVEESGQYRKLQTWRLNSWHDTNWHNFISLNLSSSVQPRVENGVGTPSQPTTDLGFHPQAMESAPHPSSPSYPALSTPASSCVDSNSSSPSYPGTTTPSLSYLGSNTPLGSCVSPLSSEPSQITISHGSPRPEQPLYVVDHPNLKAIQQCSSVHQGQDMPRTGQQMSATNGFDLGVEAIGGSPILGQRLSKGAQGSPVLSRQTSLGHISQQSPVLNRQPPLGQPVHGSPVLSRHPSVTQPQAHAVLIPHASILQVSQRSPSLDRHPMHSGYTTPDERHGNLSRQSSSSGYQGPPTPTFPISPAAYQDDRIMGMGVGFRQGSPAPVVQPQLPEKRRMSSGDKPNGTLSYGTMNGRIRSPASGGSTPSYFHTLSDFSRFNIPGKSAHGWDVCALSTFCIFRAFGWMPLGTCHDINCVVADGSPESRLNVKFVQDTSKFWYKPDISREQGEMLRIYFPLLVFRQLLKHCFYVYFCIMLVTFLSWSQMWAQGPGVPALLC